MIVRIEARVAVAVAAMVDLATQAGSGAVSVRSMARRQRIPPSYLQPLLRQLRREGIVASCLGPSGGYVLQRDPGTVSLAHIIAAVRAADDRGRPDASTSARSRADHCDASELWCAAERVMMDFAASTSLQSIIDGCAAARALAGQAILGKTKPAPDGQTRSTRNAGVLAVERAQALTFHDEGAVKARVV